jgi:membrane-bound metal-dependent hydrolase YbcI (DUF457 family)
LEPVTHALASLAIAQAAKKQLPRYGAWMIVVSGVAPDLDYLSYLGGAGAFLKFHRTALHSLAGSAAMCCAVAGAFCLMDRRRQEAGSPKADARPPLRFLAALAACALGATGHLLLDVPSGIGVQFLWPFRAHWSAWDLASNLDPWILVVLLAGLLLPQLFRLVSEEIGDKKGKTRGRGGAIFALLLICAYLGMRVYYHSEAVDLLLSREIRGREPLSGGAFPFSSTPLEWRGVAVTDTTIEVLDIPAGGSEEFEPDNSLTRFKPEDSPALEAAQNTSDAQALLKYARFPIASVVKVEDDFRVEVHDAQFMGAHPGLDDIFVRVDLDSAAHVKKQQFRFASDTEP